MNARQWPGKRIGVQAARKLMKEGGGTPDLELRAQLERVLGYAD